MLAWCDCYAPLFGRILVGGFFLWSGIMKVLAFSLTVAYIASAALPYPTAAAIVAVVIEVGLGIALVIGWNTRLAALALAAWTVTIAFTFHTNLSDQTQLSLMLKDLAITGGLLYMSAYGSGRWSLRRDRLRAS